MYALNILSCQWVNIWEVLSMSGSDLVKDVNIMISHNAVQDFIEPFISDSYKY